MLVSSHTPEAFPGFSFITSEQQTLQQAGPVRGSAKDRIFSRGDNLQVAGSIPLLCHGNESARSRGRARSWLLWNRIPALTEGRQKGHTLGTTEKTDLMGRKTQAQLVNTPKQASAGCLCPASLGSGNALPESRCLLTRWL